MQSHLNRLAAARRMAGKILGPLSEQGIRKYGELGMGLLRFRASRRLWQVSALLPFHAQAVAPFHLAYHEARASVLISSLSPRERDSLFKMARRLRDLQLRMAELSGGVELCFSCAKDKAGKPGGSCCASYVSHWFIPVDGLFRRLLNQRASLLPSQIDQARCCGYLGPTGCTLRLGHRPLLCAMYFCAPLKEELAQHGQWQAIQDARDSMCTLMAKLEARLLRHQQKHAAGAQNVLSATRLLSTLVERQQRVYEKTRIRQRVKDSPPSVDPRQTR